MSQVQRLLLLASPTMVHTPAFERARALALAADLPLHIVEFAYVSTLTVAGLFAPEQMKQARGNYLNTHRQWLEQLAEQTRKQGIEVTCEVVLVKHPYEEILRYVNEMSLALIIKDAEKESVLKRSFFTPLDWQLLRDCPVPVHLVTEARNPWPRRVLAIVDVLRGEDQDLVLNDQIIDAAVKLAEQCKAKLDLLHVYDWSIIYMSDLGLDEVSSAAGHYKALGNAQREVFSALAERHGVPAEHRHFVEGIPLRAICTFAAQDLTDVIVMGTVQHRGLDKYLGSTAEHLLHRAPCSVLAIKPTDESSPYKNDVL